MKIRHPLIERHSISLGIFNSNLNDHLIKHKNDQSKPGINAVYDSTEISDKKVYNPFHIFLIRKLKFMIKLTFNNNLVNSILLVCYSFRSKNSEINELLPNERPKYSKPSTLDN
ncbi:hypothetical protein BpHYR1_001003 [Brachionus plicatilis]|uniref:Uncharacterized protein n=1 Tax=Brachionus plicatilis TaxID=10195 RepID=A0A3M7PB76_BRAPC|nr:hypothetical protein BpHYR1_001003 [Brachionus plicatilis]